jgi:hypothetical protein
MDRPVRVRFLSRGQNGGKPPITSNYGVTDPETMREVRVQRQDNGTCTWYGSGEVPAEYMRAIEAFLANEEAKAREWMEVHKHLFAPEGAREEGKQCP